MKEISTEKILYDMVRKLGFKKLNSLKKMIDTELVNRKLNKQ